MSKRKASIHVGMIKSPHRTDSVFAERQAEHIARSYGDNVQADTQSPSFGTAITASATQSQSTASPGKNPTPLSSDHFPFPRSLRSSSFSSSSSRTMSKKPSATFGGASTGTGPLSSAAAIVSGVQSQLQMQAQPQQQQQQQQQQQPVQPPQSLTADPSLLNKIASSSTGIYQQSVLLRSHLQRIIPFTPFLVYSQSGARASQNVVRQLWETFALGRPLVILFNLLDVPSEYKITEYSDVNYDFAVEGEPTRKERQRAIALFIMAVDKLRLNGIWDKDAPLFSLRELHLEELNTNGFVKVVATLLYLMSKLPPYIMSDDVERPSTASTSSITSKDDKERTLLVRELIETERKYCQDLETMLNYEEALRQSNLVDEDTIHKLFPALGKLTDFQRKILICMEATYENPLDDQDWGECFVKHEKEFEVYDAYIANYGQALDLAIAEQPTLMSASQLISPAQLPAFLIKPIQRLCRYPMLLNSLHKLTPPTSAQYISLTESCEAVKRIADAANRAIREKENADTKKDIFARVKDWKGINSDSLGLLLLDDVFGVDTKPRGYNEYHIFLFGRMLLLCRPKEKEGLLGLGDGDKDKEEKKGMPNFFKSVSTSNLKSSTTSSAAAAASTSAPSAFLAGGAVASRRSKAPFSIRGSLYIRNIIEIVPEVSGPYNLHIKYQDRIEQTKWTLICRNDEQVNLWHGEIKRLLDVWAVEEAEIRKAAKVALMAMKEQQQHPGTQSAFSSRESLNNLSSGPSVPSVPSGPATKPTQPNRESLDSMRSARRPMHPYHYTFDSTGSAGANYAQKTRNRNGSLDYGGDFKSKGDNNRPTHAGSTGRGRSASVSSMASDVYEVRSEREFEGGYMSSSNNSLVDLSAPPSHVYQIPVATVTAASSTNNSQVSLGPPQLEWKPPSPNNISDSFEERIDVANIVSEPVQTYVRPLPIPGAQPASRPSSSSASAPGPACGSAPASRSLHVPPPQAPPPTVHQLPQIPLSPPPGYTNYSRHATPSPNPSPRPSPRPRAHPLPPPMPAPAPTTMLPPVPPVPASAYAGNNTLARTPSATLRQRVGDRIPAPLTGVTPAASGTGSASTYVRPLPDPSNLPSPSFYDYTNATAQAPSNTPSARPLSNRKSTTPLRGPRERGQTAPGPPNSAYVVDVSNDKPSQSRSRSHSHSSNLQPQSRTYSRDQRTMKNIVERADSESSFASDYSRPTSSEESPPQISPITPLSSGSDGRDNRLVPNRPRIAAAVYQSYDDIPEEISEEYSTPQPEYNIEKTPQTAYHEPSERAAFLSKSRDREQVARAPSNGSSNSEYSVQPKQSKRPKTPRTPGHSRSGSTTSNASNTEPSDLDNNGSMITVRLHSEGSKFIIQMPNSTSRQEFVDRIRKKIRSSSQKTPVVPTERLRSTRFVEAEQVSYLDAHGRFAALKSNDDFAMAWMSVTCVRPNPEDRGILILAVGPTDHIVY